jgi:putative aldouronate transport system permease protein
MKTFVSTLRKQWQYHVLLIPAVVLVFIFSYIPLYGLIIAFQKYNPAMGFKSPWVGMDNFEYLFRQPNFVRTIWNTFFIAVMKLIGGIIVPVTFALLLNEVRSTKVKRTYQTVVYMPNFLSWVIMAGVMIDILSVDGAVNSVLGMVGIGPVNFLGDNSIFPWTMILSDIWKTFGFGTVVYLAALTGIDPGLYEAAIVDGARRWKQTIYITLPMLMPTVVLMTILALGNVLNAGFDQIYNLYSPMVYKSGDIIDTYVYRLGIQQAQYSVGTAVGMFKSLVSGVLICISYYLADRLAGYRVF